MHNVHVQITLHGVQVVDEIFDRHAAARMGIDKVKKLLLFIKVSPLGT